ncbi:MAG: hypothetical protein ABIF77_08105 [bacterium]
MKILKLNSETIRTLSNTEMQAVGGAYSGPHGTCYTNSYWACKAQQATFDPGGTCGPPETAGCSFFECTTTMINC